METAPSADHSKPRLMELRFATTPIRTVVERFKQVNTILVGFARLNRIFALASLGTIL